MNMIEWVMSCHHNHFGLPVLGNVEGKNTKRCDDQF